MEKKFLRVDRIMEYIENIERQIADIRSFLLNRRNFF